VPRLAELWCWGLALLANAPNGCWCYLCWSSWVCIGVDHVFGANGIKASPFGAFDFLVHNRVLSQEIATVYKSLYPDPLNDGALTDRRARKWRLIAPLMRKRYFYWWCLVLIDNGIIGINAIQTI
jgi:hypothetical protein